VVLSQDFAARIRALVRRPGYRPLNKSELARELGVAPKERAPFRRALAMLEEAGELVRGKKSRFRLPRRDDTGGAIPGRFEIVRTAKRPQAYFYPDDPAAIPAGGEGNSPDRVAVPWRQTATALPGDRVTAAIAAGEPPRWHRHVRHKRAALEQGEPRWEARVVSIEERAEHRIVGTYHRRGHNASVEPEDSRLPKVFHLVERDSRARPGDVVVAELVKWDRSDLPPLARVTEVLGRQGDERLDILKVIHRHGLPLEFPHPVLAEAERISMEIGEEEIASREDWREREVFTIDPEDARDFDDAICVTPLDEGGWELAVHIADVSHYVKPGSALDREARKRGNSVYLADRVIPMLPEKLSNGLCSLRPDEDRLTHAAVMTFDERGRRKGVRFVSAVIHSKRRYTYEEAYARMKQPCPEPLPEGRSEDPERALVRHLHRAWELGSLLRRNRFRDGALDLDFAEVRVVIDEEGRAVGAKRSEYDESHQLIEEFMLSANEAVAETIKNAGVTGIYRVHEDADPERLEEFAELARSFGHPVGDVRHRPELQKLLREIRGSHEEHSLKIALLKSLQRARYSRDPIGHYGLSKTNYTHFTSPIRRYADLVVHRVLRRLCIKRQAPHCPGPPDRTPGDEEMGQIAEHISRTERVAADAEMETQRIKMIEYLERLVDEEPHTAFDATVTEARPLGVFVELDELLVKGLVRKEDLPRRDSWWFDRTRNQFRSRGGGRVVAAGDSVRVQLARIDHERGFVDFRMGD